MHLALAHLLVYSAGTKTALALALVLILGDPSESEIE